MEDAADTLTAAREAYARGDWMVARDGFLTAREERPLGPGDLAALSDAAWWLGLTDETLVVAEEAYHQFLQQGDKPRAAHLALDIGFLSMLRGDVAFGSGWISRAERTLVGEPECAEHALLAYASAQDALAADELDAALASARQIQDIGRRHEDPTTQAIGLVVEGLTLIKRGDIEDGVARLDEAMLPVTAGQVAPAWAGNIYCQMMATCHELADVRRAREWTAATERWCEGFTSAAMFAGICRVHRAQLLALEGRWERAEQESLRVCRDLAGMNVDVVAEGHYQVGEMRRLRGDFAAAMRAYEQAQGLGRDPQPGIALVRLAEGHPHDAATSIRAALVGAANDRVARARLCAGFVEIALANGDVAAAQDAVDELERFAGTYPRGAFQATAGQAQGAVWIAKGSADKALPLLRDALRDWQALGAPYETAKVRVLLAQAYRQVGDTDGSSRELEHAAEAFRTLGARPDSDRSTTMRRREVLPGGLTPREAQVLACVAAGQRNRDIAVSLHISEKTVARHLSNIFTKLGLSSRTEAAAYAFDHGLTTRGRG